MDSENRSPEDEDYPIGPTYDEMLIEAVSTINDGNGADIEEIYDFCEERFELPEDYRKVLEEELNILVSQNKVEKVETLYKILDGTENRSPDVANAPGYTYDEILISAISTINNGNGVDIDGIYGFCEEKFELPEDYRKLLEESLKNLVSQNKLEQVETLYKIHDDTEASSPDFSAPWYTNEDLVVWVISKIDDGNGVDIAGIYKYCEEKYNIPEDYMKVLEEALENLVSQNKLDKVETRYKIHEDTTVTEQEIREKSEAAAKALAESDVKELEAKEALELVDEAQKLAERSEMMLEIAKEIAARCAKGEIVSLKPQSPHGPPQ